MNSPTRAKRHHSTSRARLCPGHHARASRHHRPLPCARPPHPRPQTPRPPRAPRFLSLSLPRSSSQLYPSAHNVLILDAHSLALVRVLAFWEALPSSKHIRGSISALAVDPGLKLVRPLSLVYPKSHSTRRSSPPSIPASSPGPSQASSRTRGEYTPPFSSHRTSQSPPSTLNPVHSPLLSRHLGILNISHTRALGCRHAE